MAEDAAGAPFGPVCMAMAGAPLDCLATKDLREYVVDVVKREAKAHLERDEIAYIAKALGWA